jgi:hypothetical protein
MPLEPLARPTHGAGPLILTTRSGRPASGRARRPRARAPRHSAGRPRTLTGARATSAPRPRPARGRGGGQTGVTALARGPDRGFAAPTLGRVARRSSSGPPLRRSSARRPIWPPAGRSASVSAPARDVVTEGLSACRPPNRRTTPSASGAPLHRVRPLAPGASPRPGRRGVRFDQSLAADQIAATLGSTGASPSVGSPGSTSSPGSPSGARRDGALRTAA